MRHREEVRQPSRSGAIVEITLSARFRPMGPLHCPLCIGLALLSIGRVGAQGLLLLRMGGQLSLQLRNRQAGGDQRIRVEADAVNALLHQKAGEIGVITGGLAA